MPLSLLSLKRKLYFTEGPEWARARTGGETLLKVGSGQGGDICAERCGGREVPLYPSPQAPSSAPPPAALLVQRQTLFFHLSRERPHGPDDDLVHAAARLGGGAAGGSRG
eukprot:scaffold104014_cov24-Tisochrysis_lutea.AAC.1